MLDLGRQYDSIQPTAGKLEITDADGRLFIEAAVGCVCRVRMVGDLCFTTPMDLLIKPVGLCCCWDQIEE